MSTKLIILAAGKGERLRPYTDNCPKCMVELAGRSLLDWQIKTARSCGIKDIVVVKGYLAESITRSDVRYYVNSEYDSTNMVYTLWTAEAEFDDEIIISYADIVYEPSVLMALLESKQDISVVVDREFQTYWQRRFTDPTLDAESLRINPEGLITDIGKPITSLQEPDAQYIGLMRFSRKGIETLRRTYAQITQCTTDKKVKGEAEKVVNNLYMTDLLQGVIDNGNEVHPVEIDRKWLEIDTVSDYDLAKTMVSPDNSSILINN